MKQPVPNKPVVYEKLDGYVPKDKFEYLLSHIPPRRVMYEIIFLMNRYMGRRPCETAPIHIDDIHLHTQSIRFMLGKTNEITEQHVPDRVWKALTDYIRKNRHRFVNGYIFPPLTSSADHIDPDTVGRYFRNLADVTGLGEKVTINGRTRRIHRYYDLVGSGTTDIAKKAGPLQASFYRRHHSVGMTVKHYIYAKHVSKESALTDRMAAKPRRVPRVNNYLEF